MKTIHTAGLVVVNNSRLLLAFSAKKRAWYLPGGKVDEGETVAEALVREIREELSVALSPEQLEYFTHISAPAFGEPDMIMMEQDCFFCNEPIQPVASNEILDLRYFSRKDYALEEHQVPGVLMAFDELEKRGLI
nr:NUDIX domain-containing protein [Flavihumibacter rivuli]